MLSIQLSSESEIKLEHICQTANISPSQIIQKALEHYFTDYYQKITPYELGKDLLGKYGSGKGNLSKHYKRLLKEKLHEKHAH